MMHDRFDSLVDLLLAGGLEEAERREAEAHAAGCRSCGALLADARSFRAWAVGAIAPDAPPADLEDRIVARFRAAKPRRSWPRLARAFKIAGALAAAVLLIVLGAAFTAPRGGDLIETLSQAAKSYETDAAVYPPGITYLEARKPKGIAALEKESVDGKRNVYFGLWREQGKLESYDRRLGRADRGPVDVWSDGISLDALPTTGAGLTGVFKADDAGVDIINRANAPVAAAGETNNNLSLTFKDLGEPAPETAKPPPVPEAPKPEGVEAKWNELERLKAAERNRVVEESPRDSKRENPAPEAQERKLIRNAELGLEVESYEATLARVQAILAEEKGFISFADTQQQPNGKIFANVILRVPQDRFDAALAKLRALGKVKQQTIKTEDVTKAYMDFEARLSSKQALAERLKKVLAEGKGNVKELMEVEVQLGRVLEETDAIKGELKYYDNRVGLSTIDLRIGEKDLDQPFEVVESLQSTVGVTAENVDAAYAGAQKAVAEAGGQVVDSRMTRQNDGSAKGILRAKVDAGKFPALREELRKLGHVDVDTVNQQKTARGEGAPKPDAPVRKELAVVALTVSSPALFFRGGGRGRRLPGGAEGGGVGRREDRRRLARRAGRRRAGGGPRPRGRRALRGRGGRAQGAREAEAGVDRPRGPALGRARAARPRAGRDQPACRLAPGPDRGAARPREDGPRHVLGERGRPDVVGRKALRGDLARGSLDPARPGGLVRLEARAAEEAGVGLSLRGRDSVVKYPESDHAEDQR
jgi:hypothetical protein